VWRKDHIALDRFAEYWNAPVIHFAGVVYRPIVDSTARLANLQAGAVEIAVPILPSDVDAVKRDPKLRLAVYSRLGYQSINFNLAHGPRASAPLGQEARVRQAFALTIDREALVQVVYNGMFPAIAQAVPPARPFYDPGVAPPPRDVARAKALLREAGVTLPVTVILTVPNSPEQLQMGEVIQSMAADAGFAVKAQAMELASALDAADRGDFQALLLAWSGRVDVDGNLWNFVHRGGPLNYLGYANDDVDRWLEQARASSDTAGRRALYAKVGAKIAGDLPIMYLHSPRRIVGMSAKLDGFNPVPDGMVRLQGMTMAK
jgi:peptide/nickel transport system substrate-binding protein